MNGSDGCSVQQFASLLESLEAQLIIRYLLPTRILSSSRRVSLDVLILHGSDTVHIRLI